MNYKVKSLIAGIIIGLLVIAFHGVANHIMTDKNNNAVKNNARITKLFCVSGNLAGIIDTGTDSYMLYLKDCYNRKTISCSMNGDKVEYKKDRMCLDMP